MSFAHIRGQEHAVGILRRSLDAGRVSHAYLFEGPAGCGKMPTALALATALFCGRTEPCGTCPACLKMAKRQHPDFHLLEPEKGVIKIDQVRELQKELALRPVEATRKCCIISGAETLNPAAANAFLKTLEEPPGAAVIILLTDAPTALIPTIISRCQRLRFGPLSLETVEQLLVAQGVPAAEARFSASLSGGSMERALTLAGEAGGNARREIVSQVSALTGRDFATLTATAERLGRDREGAQEVVEILTLFFRDALILDQGGIDLVNADLRDLIEQAARSFHRRGLLERLDALLRAGEALIRNVNPRLTLEELFLSLAAEG